MICGKVCIKFLVIYGRECFKYFMFFENLLIILLIGVFLKKLKGVFIMLVKVFWWIFLVDVIMMNIIESFLSMFKRVVKYRNKVRNNFFGKYRV